MKKARILAFVLALALVLAACGPTTPDDSSGTTQGGHIHSYTKWGYDETNHWKYCEQDNEKDSASVAVHDFSKIGSDANGHWNYCAACGMIQESSKAEHVDENVDGKCDVCQHAVQIPVQYSTVSGKITLTKAGKSILEAKSVKLVLSDGFDTVEPLELKIEDDGTFSFKIIAGEYTLTVSKDGYFNYKSTIKPSEGENVQNIAIDLQYNLMSLATSPGWDGDYLDFTHQNDEKPYFSYNCNVSSKTLDTMTVDSYDNAMFTWYAKRGQTLGSDDRAGVWVQFYNEEDGKSDFLWLTVKGSGNLIEWYGDSLWPDWTNLRNLTNKWSISGGNMTEEEIAQYEEGTLAVSIARYENVIMAVVNGEVRDTIILDEKYADMDAHFGILGFDGGNAEGEAKFYFDITEGVEKLLPEEKIAINLPTVDNVTMETSRKECYAGQGFTVTFTTALGYEVTSFKVGERELAGEIKNGKVIVSNYNGEEIIVKVEQRVDFELAIDGLTEIDKQNLDKITKLTFTNQNGSFTLPVEGGKVYATSVYPGSYTVTTDSADFIATKVQLLPSDMPESILLTKDREFNEVALFWGDKCTEVYNMISGKHEIVAVGTIMHQTVEKFDKVSLTHYLKKGNSNEHTGSFVTFGTEYVWVTIKHDGELGKIEWTCNTWMPSEDYQNITESTWNGFGEGGWKMTDAVGNTVYSNSSYLTEEELAMFEDGTLKLTMVRDGAKLYVLLNERLIGVRVMDSKYADMQVNVGISSFGSVGGSTFNYDVETDISAYLEKYTAASDFRFEVKGDHVSYDGNLDGYHLGDFAKISLKADEGYIITNVKVNGEATNATEITRLLLSADVENVVIEVTTEPASAENEIEFEYNDIWGWNGAESRVDESTGKHYIYQVNGDMIGNVTKAGYDQVAITQYVKADVTSDKSGVLVKIGNQYIMLIIKHSGDDKGVIEWDCNTYFDEWAGYSVNNISKLTINSAFYDHCSWAEWCMFDENLGLRYRDDSASENRLTDEEMAMFEAGTLKLTLVRNATNIYAFVNDHLIGSRCLTNNSTMSVEDAQGEVTVGIFANNLQIGDRLEYEVETDISEYLEKCEGQSNLKYVVNGEHVTVEGKTEDFNIGEIAKIKLVAEEGYTITSVKVNGQEVSSDTVARYILYKNMGDVNIEVTTEPTA